VLEAQVPGNLELDLQRNGIIEEPFFGMNIVDLRRYETAHVWYCRRFEAQARADHEAYLVFEGLDCFAEIYLNDKHIGSCDNMLIPHEFEVGNYLQGDNELTIHIRPAYVEAKKFDYPPATFRMRFVSKACTCAKRNTLTAGTSCRVRCRRSVAPRFRWCISRWSAGRTLSRNAERDEHSAHL
jgi:hypothetical protein